MRSNLRAFAGGFSDRPGLLAFTACRCNQGRQRKLEPLWSPVVATGGNQWQIQHAREWPKQAKTVALSCHQLPIAAHGKEGIDGSSPSEGFKKVSKWPFLRRQGAQLALMGQRNCPQNLSPPPRPRPRCGFGKRFFARRAPPWMGRGSYVFPRRPAHCKVLPQRVRRPRLAEEAPAQAAGAGGVARRRNRRQRLVRPDGLLDPAGRQRPPECRRRHRSEKGSEARVLHQSTGEQK